MKRTSSRKISKKGASGMNRWLWIALAGVLAAVVLSSIKEIPGGGESVAEVKKSEYVEIGNTWGEDGVKVGNEEGFLEEPARLTDRSEVMLYKSNFIVSYNLDTYCPNYVAWRLTRERVEGEVSRTNKFRPDEDLAWENQVVTGDYANSGYDRGHMCPAADNKDSEENMRNSFLMTNICPQIHNLNAGDWQELEDECRQWAVNYGDIYIVCGPVFKSNKYRTIGKEDRMRIAVPDGFFKVVLMMGKNPKALGFVYPNEATNRDIRDYVHSVDVVEKVVGMDFYPALPDDVEERIEAECKPEAWGI